MLLNCILGSAVVGSIVSKAEASSLFLFKRIARKSAQAAKELDSSVYPRLPVKLIEPRIFKLLQLTGMFLLASILPPFPSNLLLPGIMIAAFAAPLTSQFLVPATSVLSYLLILRYLRSTHRLSKLPLITPPSLILLDLLQFDVMPMFLHLLIATLLWLFRSNKNLHWYATRIGNANIIGLLALFVLPSLWGESDLRLLAVMDALNVILVALTLWHYFSDNPSSFPWTVAGILSCGLFLLARHHGELMGVIVGGCLAAAIHFPFSPRRFRCITIQEAVPPLQFSSSLEDFTEERIALHSDRNANTQTSTPAPIRAPPTPGLTAITDASQTPTPIPAHVPGNVAMNPHQFSDPTFEELALLGKSSTRTLHKVRHTLTGAVYVRKTITPREMSLDQIRKELRPLRALTHPNIIRCLGIYGGEYGEGELNVVLEYHAGGNLGSIGARIKQAGGVIEENTVGNITEGILQGLAFLHDMQILHRDIKPSNVLFSSEGIVKLSEFVPSGESVNRIGDTFLAFVPYTAPERVLGVHYADRADIWSMGITLLECIRNRRPYPEHLEAVGLMLYITDNNIAPPQLDEAGAWTDDMRNFFSQILVKDPNSRPGARALLAHPWITAVMQKDVKMDLWLRRVRRVQNVPRFA